jgi:glycosyltransferase involved in cell wall biosynthesis
MVNLSLAANTKIPLIADLLIRSGHVTEVISPGEIVQHHFRYFRGFDESMPAPRGVRVYYASALPIRRLNGLWAMFSTTRLFKARHRTAPFDIVIIYNMKPGHIACANYAVRRLGLPVILDYEDCSFVNVRGETENGIVARYQRSLYSDLLKHISACVAVSPYLLSQVPVHTPKLLLRGVVGEEYGEIGRYALSARKDWIVFSGTHSKTKGLDKLIMAWRQTDLTGWELHIAGHGEETAALKKAAEGANGIVFHGLLNRLENAQLLGSAKIAINPHEVSGVPGNVFAFKIIESLAAGNHVITTRMGDLEPEIEAGVTYLPDNRPETIAEVLKRVVRDRLYVRRADLAANERYGAGGASKSLKNLLQQAVSANGR